MELRMTKRRAIALVGTVGLVGVLGAGAAVAGGRDDGATDRPITGAALKQATEAALAETGGGRVTETEVGDEESLYEVEVTLGDGSQVDVQLDDQFHVVGSKTDHENG